MLLFFGVFACLCGPEIGIEGNMIVNFGTYPAKDRKEAAFLIVNKGDQVLKILEIRKNCGCASSELRKRELAPGEKTPIRGIILADSIYGAYSKNIFIESNDPGNRFLKLTLSGKAEPLFNIKPKDKISLGRLPIGEEWRQAFLLETTQDGVEFGEIELEGNYPVELSFEKSGGRSYRLELAGTPEKADGKLACKINIPVKKPGGWKEREIVMTADVGTEFRCIPGRLYLPTDFGAPEERKFQLRLLGPSENLDLKKISLENTAGVQIELKPTSGNICEVFAKFSPEFLALLSEKRKVPLSFSYPGSADAVMLLISN